MEADIKEVSEYFTDVNAVDSESRNSLLVEAVKEGQVNIVKALIAHDCNVEIPEEGTGKRPLFLAVEFGYTEITELLLKRQANQLVQNTEGLSVLETAVSITSIHRLDIVNLLLGCRTTCETAMHQNFRALAIADDKSRDLIAEHVVQGEMVQNKKVYCFKAVLSNFLRGHEATNYQQEIRRIESFFDVFKTIWPYPSCLLKDVVQFTLFLAAEVKKTKLLEFLLSKQSHHIYIMNTKETVLTLLLKSPVTTTDSVNIASLIEKRLLDKILVISNPSHKTPIEMAVELSHVNVISALMKRTNIDGAYIIPEGDRRSALKSFLKKQRTLFTSLVSELDNENKVLALSCVVDQNNEALLQPINDTLLMTRGKKSAAEQKEIIDRFLAVPDIIGIAINKPGQTALTITIELKQTYAVNRILSTMSKEDILKEVDGLGNNVLAKALELQSTQQLVEVVLEQFWRKGIPINNPNKNGETALSIAISTSQPEIVTAVMKRMSDEDLLSYRDGKGNNILALAVLSKKILNVKAVLGCYSERNLAFSVPNGQGHTALTIAMATGQYEFVDLLLHQISDAEIATPADQQNNALASAVVLGDAKAVEVVLSVCDEKRLTNAAVLTPNRDGLSALFLAIECKNSDVLAIMFNKSKIISPESLLASRCKQKDKFNDASPLVFAAASDNYNVTKFLYEHGAEIDKQELLNGAPKHLVTRVVALLVRYAKEILSDRQNSQKERMAVQLTTIAKMAGEARSPALLAMLLETAEIQALLPDRDLYAAIDSALTSEEIEERKALVQVLNSMADRRKYAAYALKKGERKLLDILHEGGFDFFGTAKNLLLHQAIAEDYDLEGIDFIIDRGLYGASLTDRNASGETALHLAAKNNRAEIVDLLLKKQASPTLKDKNGRTPLYAAVENGSLEALQKFKGHFGASRDVVNTTAATNQHPLWLAFFEKRNLQISRLLIEMDALIDEGFVKELFNPKYNTEQLIEDYLTGLGISINRESLETGNTLLMTAIENTSENSAELIKNLINKPNVDLNISNKKGHTALVTAIHMNRADAVTLILAKTSSEDIIKRKDDEGNSILSIAVVYSSYNVVSVILEEFSRRKISVSEPNKNGQTALYKALEKRESEVVKAIMKKSDEGDLVCSDINIISLAIQFRSLQCVQAVFSILEDRRIAFNLPDKNGDTPLVKAFAIDDPFMVPVILEKMSDEEIVDQVDKHGHNSLAKAVQLGGPRSVEAVLAECNKRGLSEKTASKEGYDGISPFFYVLQHGLCDMLLKFLENSELTGCLVNSRSSSGGQLKGASALAVASKHYSVYCLLLEHGAVIDEQEIVNSPENFRQIVKMLIKFASDICQAKQSINTKFDMEHNKKIAQSQLLAAAKIAGNRGDCFILGEIIKTPCREMINTKDLESAIDLAFVANKNDQDRRQLIEAINSTSEFRKLYIERILREGDREILNSFLEAGLAFYSEQGEETVLVQAVHNKYPLASVAFIIDNSQTCHSSISDRNTDGETVLHLAAKNNQNEIVEFLLQKSASPLDVDNSGRTALHVAVQRGHLEIVETMKTRLGKSMSSQVANRPSKDGKLPIWQAFFYQKNTKLFRLLLDIGAQIDESFVAQLFEPETVGIPGNKDARHAIERYLELGVDVNKAFGTSAETVLMIAVRRTTSSETEVTKVLGILLIQTEINLKAVNGNDDTALDIAIGSESPAAVALLLRRLFAEDNSCIFDILTLPKAKMRESRFVVVARSSLKILRVILDVGREFGILKQIVEHKSQPNGDSPLIAAVETDNYQLAELLLEYEADVNADDSKALLNAVLTKKEKMAELLLSKGASIKSALHMAVASRDHKMLNMLLHSKECQPNADKVIGCRNELGDNVLAIAVRCRDSKMVKLLLDKIQEPTPILNNFNCAGFTPLTIACVSLNTDIMRMLFEKGADASVRMEKGEDTILLGVIRHFNAEFDHLPEHDRASNSPMMPNWPPTAQAVKVIKLLLLHGSSASESDKFGNSVLMLACASSNFSQSYNLPLDMARCLYKSIHQDDDRRYYCSHANHRGTTPLMIAAIFGNLELCEYLEFHGGARFDTKDNDGNDARWFAKANNMTHIVKYAESYIH